MMSDERDPLLDFVVMLLQALVAGWIAAIAGAVLARLVGWQWPTVAAVTGIVITGATYWQLLGDRRPALPEEELQPPGRLDLVTPVRDVYRIEIAQELAPTHVRTRLVDLPADLDHDRLARVSQAVLEPTGRFSRRYLCKRRGLLSQGEYADLLDTWKAAGLLIVEANNHVALTRAGRAVLEAYAARKI
jgi:hypothetical protein